jgi:hypothetical protein
LNASSVTGVDMNPSAAARAAGFYTKDAYEQARSGC